MSNVAYEVIEYDPSTGETTGVLMTSALGPSRQMSRAEVIGRIDEPMISLLVELEASLYSASSMGSLH